MEQLRIPSEPAPGEVVRGVVRRVSYRSPQNGFTVLRLEPDGDPLGALTVVGYLPDVQEGEHIEVRGSWDVHPRYGPQFQAESFHIVVPESQLGIKRYLASGLVKGVGPATAERLVDHFGAETLDVIETQPERLLEVPGIGPKKAQAIHKGLVRRRSVERVMIFLQGYGVSPAFAARVYKEYGDAAIEVVRSNPYRLAHEVFGIGFRTADRLARALGVDESSPRRLEAGIRYTLEQASAEGHVYLPRAELVAAAARELGTGPEIVEAALAEMLASGQLVVRPGVGRLEGRLDADPGEDAIYRPEMDAAERFVAERLAECTWVSGEPGRFDPGMEAREEAAVRQAAEEVGLSLTPEQVAAVRAGLNAGLLVLTGGPGTGKTTIVRVLLHLLKRLKQKVLLACPTGRAAQRLSEATGEKAQTVHRLLEFGYEEERGLVFQRHEGNPLEADVVLIDEASMLDLWLAYHLLRALPRKGRLILVGDVDQLPSVGPGAVLRDILQSGAVEAMRLSRVFRQEEGSDIVAAAHAILEGREPAANRSGGDFFFIEEEDPEKVAATVVDLAAQRIPSYLGGDPVHTVQVLSPMRRTETGVEHLNRLLQERLNPRSPEDGGRGRIPFWPGDKVMQIRNNYRKRVFNGDIGQVVDVDPEEMLLRVAYPTPDGPQVVEYDDADWDELTLAYCISVHKSQGSEYPAVVLPLTTQHYVMLRRKLLYTAVTRARRMAVLVGSRRALRIALRNTSEDRRYSLLRYRLRQAVTGFREL